MTSTVVYQRSFFADIGGLPLDSGSVYIGTAGADPEVSPIQCYWDAGLTTPATQPLSVTAGYIVNAGARAAVYVAATDYSLRARNRAGVQVDYVANANFSAAAFSYSPVRPSTASAATVAAKLATIPNVVDPDFGVIPDGSTDNTAALARVKTFLALRSASGFNTVNMDWAPGRYVAATWPDWAINRLHMDFKGETWLINTGTGITFPMDGGAAGAGVYGIVIRGFPLIYGPAGSQHGAYMRSVHRSDIEINVRGAGTTYSGLFMAWCVSNTMKLIMNYNEGGLYSTPARGITMTTRGVAEETSYNTFINPECSGMPIGIYQDGALGNLVLGGAVQNCSNYGVQQTANAWENKFIGTDFEVNTTADILCDARESQFIGCDSYTLARFTANAKNCRVIGGSYESLTVDAGAARTLLSGAVYNRFGAGVLTNGDLSTRYHDLVNLTTAAWADSYYAGSAVYDPPNLADGAGTTTTVTVTGAALGDYARASFSLDLQGIVLTAWVSAADTVSVRFQNESGGALDLASGTLRARVEKL
jgi:hypothetical protein